MSEDVEQQKKQQQKPEVNPLNSAALPQDILQRFIVLPAPEMSPLHSESLSGAEAPPKPEMEPLSSESLPEAIASPNQEEPASVPTEPAEIEELTPAAIEPAETEVEIPEPKVPEPLESAVAVEELEQVESVEPEALEQLEPAITETEELEQPEPEESEKPATPESSTSEIKLHPVGTPLKAVLDVLEPPSEIKLKPAGMPEIYADSPENQAINPSETSRIFLYKKEPPPETTTEAASQKLHLDNISGINVTIKSATGGRSHQDSSATPHFKKHEYVPENEREITPQEQEVRRLEELAKMKKIQKEETRKAMAKKGSRAMAEKGILTKVIIGSAILLGVLSLILLLVKSC